MGHIVNGRKFAALACGLAIIGASAAGLAPAQAGVRAPAQIGLRPVTAAPATNFHGCQSPAVCIWSATGFSGNEILTIPTDNPAAKNGWEPLRQDIAVPWGSFVNNSGSSVVFGEKNPTVLLECWGAHTVVSNPGNVRNFAYLHIEYGNSNCTGKTPPL